MSFLDEKVLNRVVFLLIDCRRLSVAFEPEDDDEEEEDAADDVDVDDAPGEKAIVRGEELEASSEDSSSLSGSTTRRSVSMRAWRRFEACSSVGFLSTISTLRSVSNSKPGTLFSMYSLKTWMLGLSDPGVKEKRDEEEEAAEADDDDDDKGERGGEESFIAASSSSLVFQRTTKSCIDSRPVSSRKPTGRPLRKTCISSL